MLIIIIYVFKTCERRYSSNQDFTLMMKAVLITMIIEYWKYIRYFAPHKLAFNHIPREEVIQNNPRQLARHLMTEDVTSNPAMLVLDGTNVYIQKSSNIVYARISYIIHKRRHIVTIMMVVTTTGYIVSVLGPYQADSTKNDTSILKHMIYHIADEAQELV